MTPTDDEDAVLRRVAFWTVLVGTVVLVARITIYISSP